MLPGIRSLIPRLCEFKPLAIEFVEMNWTFEKIAEVWALKQLDERTIIEPRKNK